MFSDALDRMILLFATGLGLALLGGANAFLRNSSLALRCGSSLGIIGLAAGTAFAATGLPLAGIAVGSTLTTLSLVVSLAGSSWFARALTAAATAFRTPALRWATVAVLGLATAIGSVFQSEDEYFANVDRQMAELESLTTPPPSDVPSARAVTDSGREIAIREAVAPRGDQELMALEAAIFSRPAVRDSVIRTQSGSDLTNCHGWVFTGGRFWITGSEVDRILTENAYQVITDPHPGDLVVYRSGTNVLHTALVRYVTEGLPVLVEGKWGCSGIYIHPVDKSVYGTEFQYYRSTRSGHLLVGMYSTAGNEARGTPHLVSDPASPGEFTD